MRILLDTNILLRTVEPTHPQHAQATDATDALRKQGHLLCLVRQNIYEFWVVATRPREANGLGMTSAEAEATVSGLLRLFTLLTDERAIFEQWVDLVVRYEIRGVRAHDARLAAAMQRHGIEQILTFNVGDFDQFDHIEVRDPSQVISTAGDAENFAPN